MATVNFRYDDLKKENLKKEREKLGFNSLSDYMVFIVENRNNNHENIKSVTKNKKIVPVGKEGKTVKTRVTPEEKKAISLICQQESVTESFLVLRQMRILINNDAHFSKEELAALRLATSQVTAIGRNLNQIVAQINSGIITDSKLSVHNIEQLKKYIDIQDQAIRALIKKTKDRVVENG